MAKKNYGTLADIIGLSTSPAGQKDVAPAEENESGQEVTQGKKKKQKGIEHRFNIIFSPENYDYIMTMSRVTGVKNVTKFLNMIIEKHREEHLETFDKAKEFLNNI